MNSTELSLGPFAAYIIARMMTTVTKYLEISWWLSCVINAGLLFKPITSHNVNVLILFDMSCEILLLFVPNHFQSSSKDLEDSGHTTVGDIAASAESSANFLNPS